MQNGLFSSLPYLGKYVMAFSSSYIADFLRQRGTLSTTATRKIFTGFGKFRELFVLSISPIVILFVK